MRNNFLHIDNGLVPLPKVVLLVESVLIKPKGNMGHTPSLTIDKSTVTSCKHLVLSSWPNRSRSAAEIVEHLSRVRKYLFGRIYLLNGLSMMDVLL